MKNKVWLLLILFFYLTLSKSYSANDGFDSPEIKSISKTELNAAAPPECKMLFCPGGTFPIDLDDRNTKSLGSFWIGETEVTYNLWSKAYSWAVLNGYHFQNQGSYQNSIDNPVNTISWRDAIVWCNALSEMSGLAPVYVNKAGQIIKDSRDANSNDCDQAINNEANGYRLPTQWEWECAARWQGNDNSGQAKFSGNKYWTLGSYPSGSHGETNDVSLYTVSGGAVKTTSPVKSKLPNYLGCYDMSGNVSEWCYGTTVPNALVRNMRGGTYYQLPDYMKLGCQFGFFPYSKGYGIGFRVALSQSSHGNDYVVSGGTVTAPVPGKARIFNTSRVCTRVDYANQTDPLLENPDCFPLCRANLSSLVIIGEQSQYYRTDDILGDDNDLKFKMIRDMFPKNMSLFNVHATGKGVIGMTPDFWLKAMQDAAQVESEGRNVYGTWVFREDAFLFGVYDSNGNFDVNYYGKDYLPPFPEIDPRIPGKVEIQNYRNALANSNLKSKTNYKLILLGLSKTMEQLLHPDSNVKTFDGLHLWSKARPTAARAAECLAYIRDNFDGYGEEEHVGFIDGRSQAAYTKWCMDNKKIAYIFMGGGSTTINKGLGFAKQSYELLFNRLQSAGVHPNDTNIIYFRQGGFQDIHQIPEDVTDDSSVTIFSEVAWLDKRLRGPVIMNSPNEHATSGQTWSFQPIANCFGVTNFSWSLSNAPAGMTINRKSGLVQWSPTSNNIITPKITLKLKNLGELGGSDSISFAVSTIKEKQIITVDSIITKYIGESNFRPAATNSGLPITYSSSNTAIAKITANGLIQLVAPGTCQITASQSGDSVYAAAIVTFVLDVKKAITTGLEPQIEDEQIKIFPNPSLTGIFNLSQICEYKVYSIFGEEIKSGKGDQVNLSEIPKGIYFIKINSKLERLVIE